MTLNEFAEQFRLLLCKTYEAGHDVDHIAQVADAMLEREWDTPSTDNYDELGETE